MAITVNEGGVLYTLDSVTSNEGGVLYPLDTVMSDEGGVLYKIHGGYSGTLEWGASERGGTLFPLAVIQSTGNNGRMVVATIQYYSGNPSTAVVTNQSYAKSSGMELKAGDMVSAELSYIGGAGTTSRQAEVYIASGDGSTKTTVLSKLAGYVNGTTTSTPYTVSSDGTYHLQIHGRTITSGQSATTYTIAVKAEITFS